MSSYFFITTFDKISAAILTSFMNIHPEIQCAAMRRSEGLLPRSVDLPIDDLILATKTKDKKLSGNISNFLAFELQHKLLAERTEHPFRKVNIVLSPILRIRFLMMSWLQSGQSFGQLFDQLHKELTEKPNANSLLKMYNVAFYYNHVLSSVAINLKKLQAAQLKDSNPEIVKRMHSMALERNKLFYVALALVLAFDSADLPCTGKKFNLETLLSSEDEFAKLIDYVSYGELTFSENLHPQFKAKSQEVYKVFQAVSSEPWEAWQTDLVNSYLNAKLYTLYGPHLNKTLADFYQARGYEVNKEPSATYTKLLSIQLNSNRPAQLSAYFDNIEETSDNPQDLEVLVNIDIGDDVMQSLLEREIPRRKFTLKYIQSPRPKSFFDLWKPLNKILEITDPGAYFLLNISDEMFFLTQGWDTILKKYVGFFPDNMFRLRASRNKFRNYFDRWECNFVQDSIPFTTNKWIRVVGDWNPCFGPDSFQQLTSFYLAKEGAFANENLLRDIPIIDIKFAGDVPALGLDPDKSWKMFKDSVKALQICQSYKMQLEARRRAMLLRANIMVHDQHMPHAQLVDAKKKKKIQIFSQGKIVAELSYKLNWLVLNLENQWRKVFFFNYFGGGVVNVDNPAKGLLRYLMVQYKSLHKAVNVIAAGIYKMKAKKKIVKVN